MARPRGIQTMRQISCCSALVRQGENQPIQSLWRMYSQLLCHWHNYGACRRDRRRDGCCRSRSRHEMRVWNLEGACRRWFGPRSASNSCLSRNKQPRSVASANASARWARLLKMPGHKAVPSTAGVLKVHRLRRPSVARDRRIRTCTVKSHRLSKVTQRHECERLRVLLLLLLTTFRGPGESGLAYLRAPRSLAEGILVASFPFL